MTKLEPFKWTKHQYKPRTCRWNDMDLQACYGGEWMVLLRGVTIVGWLDQAKGDDMADAQRRAQAAAMVIHQRQQRL